MIIRVHTGVAKGYFSDISVLRDCCLANVILYMFIFSTFTQVFYEQRNDILLVDVYVS